MEHTDGVRNISVLIYRPLNTPAKEECDTICIRFNEKPWTCPFSIYITDNEALSISAGLLRAIIKDKKNRKGYEVKE